MAQVGTGRDEGSPKSLQDGTERDQMVQDGTKSTGLQNRGLQVELRSAYGRSSLCFATVLPGL
jgi:hypothetical protein